MSWCGLDSTKLNWPATKGRLQSNDEMLLHTGTYILIYQGVDCYTKICCVTDCKYQSWVQVLSKYSVTEYFRSTRVQVRVL